MAYEFPSSHRASSAMTHYNPIPPFTPGGTQLYKEMPPFSEPGVSQNTQSLLKGNVGNGPRRSRLLSSPDSLRRRCYEIQGPKAVICPSVMYSPLRVQCGLSLDPVPVSGLSLAPPIPFRYPNHSSIRLSSTTGCCSAWCGAEGNASCE